MAQEERPDRPPVVQTGAKWSVPWAPGTAGGSLGREAVLSGSEGKLPLNPKNSLYLLCPDRTNSSSPF